MKKQLILTVLIVLAALTLTACGGGERFYSNINPPQYEFIAQTRTHDYELEVTTGMSLLSLSIDMNLDAGQLVFRLSSPDGHFQWEETFTAPANYQDRLDFDATPGIWTLEIELEDATGNYDIEMRTDYNR